MNFGVIYHITSIYGLENEPILDLDWKSKLEKPFGVKMKDQFVKVQESISEDVDSLVQIAEILVYTKMDSVIYKAAKFDRISYRVCNIIVNTSAKKYFDNYVVEHCQMYLDKWQHEFEGYQNSMKNAAFDILESMKMEIADFDFTVDQTYYLRQKVDRKMRELKRCVSIFSNQIRGTR